VDDHIRSLERRQATGEDVDAALHAARIRVGLPSDYRPVREGSGNVISDLVGTEVWYSELKGLRRFTEEPERYFCGRIVAVYVPTVSTSTNEKNYGNGRTTNATGFLRAIVENEQGEYLDRQMIEWKRREHPNTPNAVKEIFGD